MQAIKLFFLNVRLGSGCLDQYYTVFDQPCGSSVAQSPSHSFGLSSTRRTVDYHMGLLGHSDI
jgi:hypothetical protein